MRFEVTFPVLNEERRLEHGARKTMAFLDRHGLTAWSVAVADNGSSDRTAAVAAALVQEFPRLRYLSVGRRGVGLALKASWGSATADVVGYMDVDLATNLDHLLEVQRALEDVRIDVVNGSRLLPGSRVVNRTWLRTLTSHGFNTILQHLLRVRFSDGMCGFKFIRRQRYLELRQRGLEGDGWFFCTELLVKSEWSRYGMVELPVAWTDDQDSRVRLVHTITAYMKEILRLKEARRSYGR